MVSIGLLGGVGYQCQQRHTFSGNGWSVRLAAYGSKTKKTLFSSRFMFCLALVPQASQKPLGQENTYGLTRGDKGQELSDEARGLRKCLSRHPLDTWNAKFSAGVTKRCLGKTQRCVFGKIVGTSTRPSKICDVGARPIDWLTSTPKSP